MSTAIYCKMQDLAKIKLFHNFTRSFCTCDVYFKKYAIRESKFMNKIMKGEQAKRKWFPTSETTSSHAGSSNKPRVPQNSRRNTVLNKIFMKYITDLMSTGEVASGLVGKGIEVCRVSVAPDFNRVNVFWLAKDSLEDDKLAEEALIKAEGPLRHELSQLRVIGNVPMIKFVRDRQYIKALEIDRRLSMADFGEDYVPTDPVLRLKTIPSLNVELPNDVWSDVQKLELEMYENEPDIVEEALPEMRNDIFGLDQARIMATVKISMTKSRAASHNRSLNIVAPLPKVGEHISVSEYLSVKQKNAMFTAFLAKRQTEEKRRKKVYRSNYNPGDELALFDQQDLNDGAEDFDVDIHSGDIQQK